MKRRTVTQNRKALAYLKVLVSIELAELEGFAAKLPVSPIPQIVGVANKIKQASEKGYITANFLRAASTRRHWYQHIARIRDLAGVEDFVGAHQAIRLALLQQAAMRDLVQKPYLEKIVKGGQFGKTGGRPRTAQLSVEMAKEFLRRRPDSAMSETALKEEVGKRWKPPVRRSSAIRHINAGLKQISFQKE